MMQYRGRMQYNCSKEAACSSIARLQVLNKILDYTRFSHNPQYSRLFSDGRQWKVLFLPLNPRGSQFLAHDSIK